MGVVTAPANANHQRISNCWEGGTRLTARMASRQDKPAVIKGFTRYDRGTGTTAEGVPYCALTQCFARGSDTTASTRRRMKAAAAMTRARGGGSRVGSLRSFMVVATARIATAEVKKSWKELTPVWAT